MAWGPKGQLVGQQVADITLRDIAATLGKIEPAARIELDRVVLGNALEVIVFSAPSSRAFVPFVYDDKPYRRVGSTTTTMSQDQYMRLLLDRDHARHRWENQPAEGVRLEDLDREEILRTRASAIEHRRLSAGTSMDVSDILDHLGLRIDGQLTNAAQMLYGTKFLPRYPQALLELGRFRGTKITVRHSRQPAVSPARLRDGARGDLVARSHSAARGALSQRQHLPGGPPAGAGRGAA